MGKVRKIDGPIFQQRMTVKKVIDPYKFLNKQTDNSWQLYTGPLPAGKYAFVGGIWQDIKKLDKFLLAHV